MSKFKEYIRKSTTGLIGFEALLAAIAGGLIGCAEEPKITSYKTAAVESRAERRDPAKDAALLDHMFATIVPAGRQAWFFKLVAPGDKAADGVRAPLAEFLKTVEIPAGANKPQWKLPAGWTEKAGDQVRAATIEIPSGDKTLELTVTTLPINDEWGPFVQQNVARWMGQLQLRPLPAGVVNALARSTPTRSGDATSFELVGVMAAPSEGMGMSAGALPAGHPPIDEPSAGNEEAPPASTSAPAELAYEPPAEWKAGPANPMRKATFVAGTADERAEVVVNMFPANAAMADPVANAQRWAGMVDRADLTADEAKAAIKDVKISGLDGQYSEFFSPDGSSTPKGHVGAMVRRGDEVWFFVLRGPAATVKAESERFREFLETVKFAQ